MKIKSKNVTAIKNKSHDPKRKNENLSDNIANIWRYCICWMDVKIFLSNGSSDTFSIYGELLSIPVYVLSIHNKTITMYTQDLINEVKELYPESKEMHRLAETGNAFLGRYLDDSQQGGIAVDTILLATSLEELQKKARILKRKKELYGKWHEQDPRK